MTAFDNQLMTVAKLTAAARQFCGKSSATMSHGTGPASTKGTATGYSINPRQAQHTEADAVRDVSRNLQHSIIQTNGIPTYSHQQNPVTLRKLHVCMHVREHTCITFQKFWPKPIDILPGPILNPTTIPIAPIIATTPGPDTVDGWKTNENMASNPERACMQAHTHMQAHTNTHMDTHTHTHTHTHVSCMIVSRSSWRVSVWSVCFDWREACLPSWCNRKHYGRVSQRSIQVRIPSRAMGTLFPHTVSSIFRLSLTRLVRLSGGPCRCLASRSRR